MKVKNLPVLKKLYVGFGTLLLTLLILIAVAFLSFARMENANHWSVHSSEVLVETHEMSESLFNIDTGARGYAITNNKRFLRPLTQGKASFVQHWSQAQHLTVDRPLQQENLRQLQASYQQWLKIYVHPLLAAQHDMNSNAERRAEARIAEQGEAYTDAMRSLLDDINSTESRLLQQRNQRASSSQAWTEIILLSGSIWIIGLTIALSTLLVRNTQRLEQTNENLGLQVRERQRAEEALRQAKQEAEQAKAEAERANAAKSEFLSRMSHELRTPLNAILGFGQLLEVAALTPLQQESVQHILKGGWHLLDLINEVLDVARIESGQMQFSPEAVAVLHIVQEALDLVRPLGTPRRIEIQESQASIRLEQPFVQADRQRLKQVLLNLLGNAIKYNRDGGSVRVDYELVPANHLRILVRDTGPGIAPEKMERLFVPFDRLGAEQTRIEGTGLGLALSQRLMEAMGGRMGVESTVGQGSAFWIELPLVVEPDAQLALSGHARSSDAPSNDSNRPKLAAYELAAHHEDATAQYTLLYIEDNLHNLHLVETILQQRPELKLLSAMQGSGGLELAREHQPHLILLDLHLPDLSGHDVLLRLRAEPTTRHIPVVVLSADATPGQIARLLSAGALGYLTKPLNMQKFLEVIDKTLHKADGRP